MVIQFSHEDADAEVLGGTEKEYKSLIVLS